MGLSGQFPTVEQHFGHSSPLALYLKFYASPHKKLQQINVLGMFVYKDSWSSFEWLLLLGCPLCGHERVGPQPSTQHCLRDVDIHGGGVEVMGDSREPSEVCHAMRGP